MRGVIVAGVVAAAFLAAPAVAAPTNPIQAENSRQGDFFWTVTTASEGAIEGFFSETSATPGDTVHLHVNVPTGDHYRVEVHRLGWYGGKGGRRVLCIPSCTGDEAGTVQPAAPPPDPATGEVAAAWSVTDSFLVGDDWVSGYYVAELILTTGPSAGTSRRAPLIVREAESAESRPSTFLVQVPINTWQAYNSWGGKSLYAYNSSEGISAKRVSFDRPYNLFAQNLFTWEYQLVRYLEREGKDVSYATDLDVHRDPGLLLEHRGTVVAGHDEYWTREMRDGFENARDNGTNLAFMGGNTAFWQMRYADEGRTIEEYRTVAADPEPDPALKTVRFRELGRSECSLLGVQYEGGSETTGDPPRDYAVVDASLDHPWMEGTGFQAGDVVEDLVGYEWDKVVPGCVSAPQTRFFHYEGLPANADAVGFTASSGARIFASGAVEFSWALDDYAGHSAPADPRVQQFMRNVLADLGRPAPASAISAVATGANLEVTVHLPGDPRTEALVYRVAGSEPDETMTLVCTTSGEPCADAPPTGTYRYAVEVVDAWSESEPLTSAPVDVVNGSPAAVIDASSQQVLTREQVALSGTDSSDPDGEIAAYAWDLDSDGEFDDGSAVEAAITFSDPGEHAVRLRVTDVNGEDATAELIVTAMANARVEGSTLVYEAVSGEQNSITITQSEGGLRVADAVGTTGSGAGCTAAVDGTAFCDEAVTAVLVLAGDANDEVRLEAAVPAEIHGGPGDDVVSGGAGDDVFFEDAGANGADSMEGGLGEDTVSYAERSAAVSVTIGALADDGEAGEGDDVGADIERVFGGSGADRFVGTARPETLVGGGGADELRTRGGRDLLLGNRGNDLLRPGVDGRSDQVRGGRGVDRGRAERFDRVYSVELLRIVG